MGTSTNYVTLKWGRGRSAICCEQRPATTLEFVSARIELEIFRVESSRVGFFNKRNQKRSKKKTQTRLDSTRLEKYFIQLDSTRLVQVFGCEPFWKCRDLYGFALEGGEGGLKSPKIALLNMWSSPMRKLNLMNLFWEFNELSTCIWSLDIYRSLNLILKTVES